MSVKFSTVAAKMLIFLFIFGIAQPVGESYAKDKTRMMKASLQLKSKKINKRLSTAESALRSLQNRPVINEEQASYLKRLYESKLEIENLKGAALQAETKISLSDSANKVELEKLRNDITQEEKKLADSELSLSGHYFSILGLLLTIVFAIASLIGALVGYVMKGFVTEAVLKEVTVDLRKQISGIVRAESRASIGEAYTLLVQPWWENYEPQYQRFLRGESKVDMVYLRHDILIAKRLTERGLDVLNREFIEKHIDTIPRAFCTYALLVNNLVYHETANLLCNGETRASSIFRVDALISKAEECLKLARDDKLQNEGIAWYNFQETAAFALIKFGDDASQKRGRQIIRDLFEGKRPVDKFEKPPKEWLTDRWNEYFPQTTDGTGNQDLLGLGAIAIPV